MKILVLGATGLMGNAVYRVLSEEPANQVYGTVRRASASELFIPELAERLVLVEDLEAPAELERLLDSLQPQVVINCTSSSGAATSKDLMRSISMFSLLPQRLSLLCRLRGVRLIQMGSDGVFSGARGNYTEDDLPDAEDAYGIAKLLGEVTGSHAITLRTSIIGPALRGKDGLLEWFLSQEGQCRCYTRAIFSGFPTVVLAQLIREEILTRPELQGIYHIATRPISKYDLLRLVAERYGKSIELVADDMVVIDRSLSAERFNRVTGYLPPEWPSFIDTMYSYTFGLARK